jgi:hypothetical protein
VEGAGGLVLQRYLAARGLNHLLGCCDKAGDRVLFRHVLLKEGCPIVVGHDLLKLRSKESRVYPLARCGGGSRAAPKVPHRRK